MAADHALQKTSVLKTDYAGHDREQLLRSARRVLHPGGALHVATMCGDPLSPSLQAVFDPDTRCIIQHGIATRYLGHPDDILHEIESASFTRLHTEICPASTDDDQDMLYVDAVKPILDNLF